MTPCPPRTSTPAGDVTSDPSVSSLSLRSPPEAGLRSNHRHAEPHDITAACPAQLQQQQPPPGEKPCSRAPEGVPGGQRTACAPEGWCQGCRALPGHHDPHRPGHGPHGVPVAPGCDATKQVVKLLYSVRMLDAMQDVVAFNNYTQAA